MGLRSPHPNPRTTRIQFQIPEPSSPTLDARRPSIPAQWNAVPIFPISLFCYLYNAFFISCVIIVCLRFLCSVVRGSFVYHFFAFHIILVFFLFFLLPLFDKLASFSSSDVLSSYFFLDVLSSVFSTFYASVSQMSFQCVLSSYSINFRLLRRFS